jgi:mono/diheme cytochrome c family protein
MNGNLIRFMFVFGFALIYFVGVAPVAQTYPPFVKKAQSMGYPATSCVYCHANKDGGSPLNARGNWLVEEKKKRNANSVDVSWLKDYKAAKKSTKRK